MLEESLCKVTDESKKMEQAYRKGIRELEEKKEELRKVRSALDGLQSAFLACQQATTSPHPANKQLSEIRTYR